MSGDPKVDRSFGRAWRIRGRTRFAEIHDRMPVILDGRDRETWLDHRPESEGGPSSTRLHALLRACDEDRLRWHPVSSRVNRPAVDDPELLSVADGDAGIGQPGLFDC